MPIIDDEDSINITQYSDTNAGKIKKFTEEGLRKIWFFYAMHSRNPLNFSLGSNSLKQTEQIPSENIDEIYLGLIKL